MKNVYGWLKFNEELDNKPEEKEEKECDCGEDPCKCEEVTEKKKAPKMKAEKGEEKEKKTATKKDDKDEKKGKGHSAAQKAKLPWLKNKEKK